jgi:translation initiation factor 2 subunit 2
MSLDYDKMLNEARAQLPEGVLRHERFEVPRPICQTYGSRTFISNFKDMCGAINRDPVKVLKFLSKEMATAASFDGTRAIFQGKFAYDSLGRLIKRYVEENVICPVCKRPDTKIVKEKRLPFLVCSACGARSPVRQV